MNHVANLRAGLDILKVQNIDVILLGLGLPGSEGIKTVAQAIAAAPDVPIIVLTGIDTPQMVLEVIKTGVGDYFVDAILSDVASIGFHAGVHRRQFAFHRMLSKRFPFGIYYDVEGDSAYVYASLDSERVGEKKPMRPVRREASVCDP